MKIAIGSDHGGFEMKEALKEFLVGQSVQVEDVGCFSKDPVDYPDMAALVAANVSQGLVDQGIVICTTGIGVSIVANKFPRVRAALCHDELTAQMARRHNNANALCLASDVLGEELMRRIVNSWLNTEFEPGGRHHRRVRKITWIEQGKDPNTYDEKEERPS